MQCKSAYAVWLLKNNQTAVDPKVSVQLTEAAKSAQ